MKQKVIKIGTAITAFKLRDGPRKIPAGVSLEIYRDTSPMKNKYLIKFPGRKTLSGLFDAESFTDIDEAFFIAHAVTGFYLEFPSEEELYANEHYMAAAYRFISDTMYADKDKKSIFMGRQGPVIHINNRDELEWWLETAWKKFRFGKFVDPHNVTDIYLDGRTARYGVVDAPKFSTFKGPHFSGLRLSFRVIRIAEGTCKYKLRALDKDKTFLGELTINFNPSKKTVDIAISKKAVGIPIEIVAVNSS